MPAANHIAFTTPINPPGATPVLTRAQIWTLLLRKIHHAEEFVGGAITSTEVLEEYTDEESGNAVVVREVVFKEGNRRAKEKVIAYEPTKVDFHLTDGSTVSNIVSMTAEGQLQLTYFFEWRHPGMAPEELEKALDKEKLMAKTAVEGTVAAMRKMAAEGKFGG